MQPLHEELEPIPFLDSPNVVSFTYCRRSGDLATAYCQATGSGWYKTSRVPGQCITCRFASVQPAEEDDELVDFGSPFPGSAVTPPPAGFDLGAEAGTGLGVGH